MHPSLLPRKSIAIFSYTFTDLSLPLIYSLQNIFRPRRILNRIYDGMEQTKNNDAAKGSLFTLCEGEYIICCVTFIIFKKLLKLLIFLRKSILIIVVCYRQKNNWMTCQKSLRAISKRLVFQVAATLLQYGNRKSEC